MSVYKFKYKLPDQNQVEGHIVIKGDKGDKGDRGDRGEKGEKGDRGETGFGAFVYEKVSTLPSHGEPSKLYLIEKPHALATATGNPIDIDVANEDAVEDAKVLGKTEQETYEGKNLFDGQFEVGNISPVDGKNDKSTDTIRAINYAVVEENTEYTASVVGGGVRVALRFYKADGTYINSGTTKSSPNTFTTPAEAGRVRIVVADTTDTTKQLQLEAGSVATDYEPYVGGQPSPSPDYPQNIQVVTGKQTVKVLGKNRFYNDPNPYTGATTNSQVTRVVGDRTTWWNLEWLGTKLKLVQGETYTVSIKLLDNPKNYRGSCNLWLDTQGKAAAQTVKLYASSNYTSTFTYALDAPLRAARLAFEGNADGVDLTFCVQIEKGSVATDFMPFEEQTIEIDLGDIELCKLGTYQDYIYKDGDDWKVHKATRKTTLDGSEAWYDAGGNAPFGLAIDGALITTSDNNPPLVYCDKFYPVPQNASWSSYDSLISTNNTSSSTRTIRIRYIDMASLSAFQAWLSNNNTTLYYVLATPTDTTITNTSLIAELEELDAITMEHGLNVITVTEAGNDLPADLELTYDIYDSEERFDKFIWFDGWERI